MIKRKHNNKGFSLVEMIVAIAIIALVVGPILNGFFNSARINGQSKTLLQATTLAQNVMEEIKGVDLNYLLSPSSEAVVADLGDGNYELTFMDRKIAGKKYDVVATLNAKEYSAATGGAMDYNDYEQPEIFAMDAAYSGAYMPAKGAAKTYAELFHDTDAYANMIKTTTIDIEKTGDVKTATISIQYEYNGIVQEEVRDAYIFRDAVGKNDMRGLYVYFEPMYTAVGRFPKEKVIINNTGLLPVTVYLVKQNTSENTVPNENNYAVNIQVNEPGRSTDWTSEEDYEPLTVLQTNLKEEQALLSYSGAASALDAKKMVDLDDIVGGVVEDKLYKVEVAVYDKDNKEQVKITGTKEK